LDKLTSDRPVPQAAQRADPGARGPQAPSGVEGCRARRAAGALSWDKDGVPQVPTGGNADMGPAEVREHCEVDGSGKSLLRAAMQSARAYHRILKLARTIADLAGSARIEATHVAEAIQYRPRRMF